MKNGTGILVLMLTAAGLLTTSCDSDCDENDSDALCNEQSQDAEVDEGVSQDGDIESKVRTYFSLFNARDMDAFYELFDPNVTFTAPFGFSGQGLENAKKFYEFSIAYTVERGDEIVNQVFVSDNQALVVVNGKGLSDEGDLNAFRAIDHFVFNEAGKITELSIVFDSAMLLCPDIATSFGRPSE